MHLRRTVAVLVRRLIVTHGSEECLHLLLYSEKVKEMLELRGRTLSQLRVEINDESTTQRETESCFIYFTQPVGNRVLT